MYDFFHDPELTLMEGYNYIEEKNKVKKILTDINTITLNIFQLSF